MQKRRTSSFLVPFALCAMGAWMLVLAGCRKEEPKHSADPASAARCVHDEKFMGGLKAARAKQSALIVERNAVADKMKAMVEAKMAELGTEDLAKVKAALENDSAWRELYVQCTNANESVLRQRREMLGSVKERLMPGRPPTKEISK